MAGIGFTLKRVLNNASPTGTLKGYLAAAVVASGPWLLSVATMATLGVISALTLQGDERTILFGSILYAYAFSLILVGPVQLVFTRFVADKEYLGERRVLGSAFILVVVVWLAILLVPAALFTLTLPGLSLMFRLAMVALFIGSAGTWLALTFLSAARDYRLIVLAFGLGYAFGLIAAIAAGSHFGPDGYLVGFTTGQMVVFGLLTAGALSEFAPTPEWHVEVLGYLKKYPSLVLIGLSYNVGIWADKLVFWFAPTGVSLIGNLHAFPPYDRAMFISSLAMVPGLTVFVLRVETDFYVPFKQFFDGITHRAPLSQLQHARMAMAHALRTGFILLLKVQVVTVMVGLLIENPLLALAGLDPAEARLFRTGLLANSVEVMLLVTLLGLLYFDQRRSAAVVAWTFAIINPALTYCTVLLGPDWYGAGYLGGSLVALLLGQRLLWRHVAELEYHTFTDEARRADVRAMHGRPRSTRFTARTLAVIGFVAATGTSQGDVWVPAQHTSWQWQLSGSIDTGVDAEVYDVDLFDTSTDVVAMLHSQNRRAVCYLDAGTYEYWRPDAAEFPETLLGSPVSGWANERWLDIRQLDVLGPIMQRRLDMCQSKGFDGVEFDNVDGYTNQTGFPLSASDQLHFNIWLADEAHRRALSAGLKNDLDQVPDLVSVFDWALAEQCFEYDECDALQPFIAAGKAAFEVEYNREPAQFCAQANAMNVNALFKKEDLEAYRVACR